MPGEDAVEEEGVDGMRPFAPHHGAGLDLGLAPLILIANRQWDHRIEVLLLGNGGGRKHKYEGAGARDWGGGLCFPSTRHS